MKLTREQVSQLSDVELNRGMYDHYWVVNSGEPFDEFFNSIVGADKLNYLTDYNLTIPLAIKQELEVDFNKNSTIVFDFISNIRLELGSQNPLRAICEVLLMIAMERE